jgi:hypothetical protein
MFIADGGGAATSPFDTIGQSMDMFANAASSGSFAINQTGGQALLQAIRNMRDWVDTNQADLNLLSEEPKLGGSNVAIAMKPYMAHIASDGQGFLTMLLKFRESLDKAEQGINDAMKNYKATDQGGQAAFNQ